MAVAVAVCRRPEVVAVMAATNRAQECREWQGTATALVLSAQALSARAVVSLRSPQALAVPSVRGVPALLQPQVLAVLWANEPMRGRRAAQLP